MAKNKLCCRIFPVILLIVSFIIANGIWYFEESVHSFAYLISKKDIFNLLGTVLFIAIIPIGIFYWLNDNEKYQSKARLISLLGFFPAILFLSYIILLN